MSMTRMGAEVWPCTAGKAHPADHPGDPLNVALWAFAVGDNKAEGSSVMSSTAFRVQ
jgi:hypothetical protein